MKLAGITVLALLLVLPAYTQQVISVRAGLITGMQGEVYLENTPLNDPENSYPMVSQGQRLHTLSGRVEMQLGPGSVLRMDAQGILFLKDSHLTDVKLQIESGSVLVEIFQEIKENKIEVLFSDTCVELKKKGLYRIDLEDARLRVYGGKARLSRGKRYVTVKRGKQADISNNLKISKFDSKQLDQLHEWAGRRSYESFIATFNTRNSWDYGESRSLWGNWRVLFEGWVKNEDYGMSFHSEAIEEESQRWLRIRTAINQAKKMEEMKRQQELEEEMERMSRQPPE